MVASCRTEASSSVLLPMIRTLSFWEREAASSRGIVPDRWLFCSSRNVSLGNVVHVSGRLPVRLLAESFLGKAVGRARFN